MSDSVVNMFSDTVTKPTQGMLQAMMTAEVGDDMGGEDMDMGGEATGELNPMASEVPPQVSGGDVGGGLT